MSTEPKWMSNTRVMKELRIQLLHLKERVSARRIWERVFTPKDRTRLGGDLEKAYRELGTVGMWMKLRRVSQPRAIVELSHKMGCLSETTYGWLLREIGGKLDTPDQERPSPPKVAARMSPGRR